MAGRATIVTEVAAGDTELRRWLGWRTHAFLANADGQDAMEGALPDARFDPGLVARVRQRFQAMADLGGI